MENNGTISLVVDTNLFFECKALHEISWDIFRAEEIDLVVTRPVQREVDKHKNQTNGRTYRRARKTAKLFRSLLTNTKDQYSIENNNLVILESTPRVTLRLAPSLMPIDEQGISSNAYSEDDLIVGCAKALTLKSKHKVLLLTHDTGPMATAKASDVSFHAIPDDWLLPPQDSSKDRQIKQLKDQVAQLRASEPILNLAAEARNGSSIDALEIIEQTYIPLTQDELKCLIDELKIDHPVASNFGSPEPIERAKTLTSKTFDLPIIEKFTPASQEEILSYCETEYPEWIQSCQSILERLHDSLNKQEPVPVIIFKLKNEGKRPAEDLLIEFSCRGPVLIKDTEEPDEGEEPPKPLKLPVPPYSPQGQWTHHKSDKLRLTLQPKHNLIRTLNKMGHMRLAGTPSRGMDHLHIPPFDVSLLRSSKHDPNSLCWHPSRPLHWEKSASLKSDQFRHGNVRSLDFEVTFENNSIRDKGAIQCRVQASNLSDPVEVTLPVTIKKEKLSPIDIARDLIKKLGTDIESR